MKSLKRLFFVIFTGVSLSVALVVGIVMYSQYSSYIKKSYESTLTDVLDTIISNYPDSANIDMQKEAGIANSSEYWDTVRQLAGLKDAFNLAYLYIVFREGDDYHFLMDTDDLDADDPYKELFKNYEDVPPELVNAYELNASFFSEPYTDEWGTFVSRFVPISENGKVSVVLGADYDLSTVHVLLGNAKIALAISLVTAAVISGLLSVIIASYLINPIRNVIDSLKTLSTGDLTVSVINKKKKLRKDEIGQMMSYLSLMQENIKSLVIAIDAKADTLSDVGNELAAMTEQSAAAMNEISATTDNMKAKAETQAASVNETNSTMSSIVDNISTLDTNIASQAESVARSTEAISGMTQNIASVTQSLVQNKDNIQNLQAASEKGHEALRNVTNDIQLITKESERLMEINKVIQQIASQTNLLSMNAAIEAAHAGDVGRGFAVVADEIRKLAESSNEQAKTVSDVLKKICGSLEVVSVSTETVLAHFDDISNNVETVSLEETQIRSAMEEQDTDSKKILETIATSNEIMRNVKSGSSEMLNGSREIMSEGKNLDSITTELANGMCESATAIEQINSAFMRIQEISQENRESISVLTKEIGRFKIY
jgi:methyl-accepting chemotaxis protein